MFLGLLASGLAGIVAAPALRRVLGGPVGSFVPGPLDDLVPSGWRIYSVSPPMPVFDAAAYRLRIGGLVARPRTLSWAQVAALPGEEQVSDFHCVTGWSVEDVRWEGVRAAAVAELVRPHPEARHVSVFSLEEPYVDQLTMEQFLQPDVMLARRMDDRPLSRVHGAPLRLVVPRMYGYKGVKWVSAIRFDAAPALGYWEQRGYDVDAWIGRSNGYG